MLSKSEFARARDWRQSRKLSVAQLSELTGYSASSIYHFESGNSTRGPKHQIQAWAWQRYKYACAGVDAEIRSRREFDW